jgi:hypothetical protein
VKQLVSRANVKGGKLYIASRPEFDRLLTGWADCPAIVTVERAHATRSKAQNDYYWSVVVARIAAKWDKDPKFAHELLKAQFLPHALAASGENGALLNGLVIGGTTSKLNKLQFVEYLEAIVGWAAEKWDVYIPDPDPLWRQHAEAA